MARLLIVDDSRMSRKMLHNMAESNGYEVVGEASNGEEGVKLYKELKPDVVTMDITMPQKDGISCLKEIVEFDNNAKVIMVTAAGQNTKVMDAIKAGAKEFICKPYEEDQVLKALKDLVD